MDKLLESESVQRWLRNVSGKSARSYTQYFTEFLEYVKLTPDKLLAMADTDKGKQTVHDLAKQFFGHLEGQGLSSWTCTVAYAAIRSFMTWNDKKLGPMPEMFHGHTQYESDRILLPQEVAKMIDHASTTRNKAIISFLHQSAQRAGILTALRYGDIRDQVEKGINPVVIDVKGVLLNAKGVNVNKKRVRYKFAIGKETTDYIRLMVEQRREAGEQVNDDSWLFTTGKGEPIYLEVVMNAVKHAAKRAGIQATRTVGKTRDGRAKRKHEIHSHVFRRSWKNSMRTAGVTDADLLNFMLGHELPYGSAYDKFSADFVRKEYSKAEPQLTVMVSPEIGMRQERDSLEAEYVSNTGRRPEKDFPDYPSWTLERQVRFLKPVVGKTMMARAATAQQAIEAVKPQDGPEYMRIDEEQVENHCNHGYEFVQVLPSGRVLIRRKKD